jgi:hypothetical protein
MSTLTIHLPDDKHERLKALARSKSIGINKLMDELATVALANYDARVRFETRAGRGNPKRALARRSAWTLISRCGPMPGCSPSTRTARGADLPR